MLIKHFARGTGRGAGPVQYVLSDEKILTDESGKKHVYTREPKPELMRGNPELTMKLIDSIDRKWKYTSGVISFSAEDNPTIAQQEKAMDDYEKLAFAGLEKDQYNVLWVKQTDTGRVELHMVAPRMELSTGKAFNPAPPGSLKDFDALRDSLNFEHGWARPDDPTRQRIVQPGLPALKDAGAVRAELVTAADPKQIITDWLLSRVEIGVVKTRADVVASLSELGEITRQGKDHVSVRLEDGAKPLRMKGALYDEQFNPQRIEELTRIAAERKAGLREEADRGIDLGRAGESRKNLEEIISRRSSYNQGRYGKGEQRNDLDVRQPAAAIEKEPAPVVDRAGISAVSLPVSLRRDLRLDESPGRPSSPKSGRVGKPDQDLDGAVLRDASRESQLHQEQWFTTLKKSLGETYDRVRKTVVDRIESAINAVRAGYETAGRSDFALATASGDIDRISRKIDEKAGRAIGQLKMNQDNELSQFKQKINLVEFAEACGYEIDKKQSSRASKVMRRDGDKIIVSTDRDGTGIYFSVRDDADHGTIIDFIQKREGKNLGQVRQELRPWIGVASSRPSASIKQRKAPSERAEKPIAIDGSVAKSNAAWMRLEAYKGDYLTKERAIAYGTIKGVNLRQDERGNVCFPHYDESGAVCGWEVKNKGFTGFSAGGKKQIGIYKASPEAKLGNGRLVIVESGIDALSYKELHAKPTDMIVTIGGEMSPEQLARLAKAMEKAPEVVIATDRDQGGEKIAKRLLELRSDSTRELPKGKDWNDDLVDHHEASRKKRLTIER